MKVIQELNNLSSNNVWFDYFWDKADPNKGWIDFESEISLVIKSIEYMRTYLNYKKEVEQQYRTAIPLIDID